MNWKKFLLIAFAVGAFGSAAFQRSEARVSVGIGFGFPYGYSSYGYGYPYGYGYNSSRAYPYDYYSGSPREVISVGPRYHRHHLRRYHRYPYYRRYY